MNQLAKTLKEIRLELGYKSAHSFYAFLESRLKLNFNYPYYARIEASGALPSEQVVQVLSQAVGPEAGDRVVLAYCETLFPKQNYLFKSALIPRRVSPLAPHPAIEAKHEGRKRKTAASKRQVTLEPKQISALSRTKVHYFIFLILTLSRSAIRLSEIKKIFAGTSIRTPVQDLVDAKIAWLDDRSISAIDTDVRFPSATGTLKRSYEQLDLWDREFGRAMRFKSLHRRMVLRRISPRYVHLIEQFCEVLGGLVSASEDNDPIYNDEVLSLRISVSTGRLPG